MVAYGHRERVALRKLGITDDRFQFFSWQCIGTDATKLDGCIVTRLVTKGPRKGRPAYDKPHFTAVVTEQEAADELQRYEAETGDCGKCIGSGRVFKSWDHLTGTEYRPCDKCAGTGKVQ